MIPQNLLSDGSTWISYGTETHKNQPIDHTVCMCSVLCLWSTRTKFQSISEHRHFSITVHLPPPQGGDKTSQG